jgi:hypothetical protein
MPKSIKLGTNYLWVKGMQVCSNKGQGSLQRGNNHKNVKIGWGHLKFFFSRTTGPILIKLSTNHPWGREFKFFQIKGIVPYQEGVIAKE